MSAQSPDTIESLTLALREFVAERDWEQYHDLKNLSMALASEAGELLAEFRWMTPEDSGKLEGARMERVRAEVGDVLLTLLMFADRAGIGLVEAGREKLEANRLKYPVDRSKGNAERCQEA